MDVVIYTADPDEVDEDQVREALENAGFFVDRIEVRDREDA